MITINPATILYIILILLIFHTKKVFFNLVLLTIFSEMFVEMGSFISIGNSSLMYRLVPKGILAIYTIFLMNHNKIKISVWSLILIICCVLPLFMTIVFPSNEVCSTRDVSWDQRLLEGIPFKHPTIDIYVVNLTAQLILTIIIVSYIYKKWSIYDYKFLLDRLVSIVKITLIIGIVELLVKYIGGAGSLWGQVNMFFWGMSEYTAFEGRTRGYGIELTLFTKEASHYAYLLMIDYIILFTDNILKKRQKYDFWIICVFILMGACMSLSVVLFLLLPIYLSISYRWFVDQTININRIRIEKVITIVAIITGIMFFSAFWAIESNGYFFQRLLAAYEEIDIILKGDWELGVASDDWSNRIRMLSAFMTIKTAFTRPLFGYGFGVVYSHGATASLLANMGIIGSFLLYKMMFFKGVYRYVKVKYGKLYIGATLLFLSINVLNSLGLRPFIELSFIVLCFCFCMLYGTIKESNYK